MQEVFEKIIERLEEERDMDRHAVYDINHCNTLKFAYGHAAQIVQQAVAEYNNGWLPYDEPPKSNDYVLLSFANFSVPQVGRYEEDEDGGAYYIDDEDETCTQQGFVVDAWQPLPEPYQSKGE